MLFERWDEVARARRDQIALRDLAAGSSWTFGQLAAAVEKGARDQQPIAFPQSGSADFVLAVLRA